MVLCALLKVNEKKMCSLTWKIKQLFSVHMHNNKYYIKPKIQYIHISFIFYFEKHRCDKFTEQRILLYKLRVIDFVIDLLLVLICENTFVNMKFSFLGITSDKILEKYQQILGATPFGLALKFFFLRDFISPNY